LRESDPYASNSTSTKRSIGGRSARVLVGTDGTHL
jgi:hypothetical protein